MFSDHLLQKVDRVAVGSALAVGFLARLVARCVIGVRSPGLKQLQVKSIWNPLGLLLGNLVDDELRVIGPRIGDYDLACHKDKPILIRLGLLPIVSIFHPDDIAHVLIHGQQNYTKDGGYRVLERMLGQGLVTQLDESIHSIHRKEVSPAFSPKALQTIAEHCMPVHASHFLSALKERVAKEGGPNRPVLIMDLFTITALRIVAQAAFMTDDPTTLDKIKVHFDKVMTHGFSLLRINPWVDAAMVRSNAIVRSSRNHMEKIINKMTQSVLGTIKKGNSDDRRRMAEEGMMKTLLEYILLSDVLDKQAVFDHCLTFLFAGIDTTANGLAWFVPHMAMHPQIQEKLYEEMLGNFSLNNVPTLESLKGCRFLSNCLRETLRVQPPVKDVGREARKDDVLPGSKTFIPAHCVINVAILVSHQHKALWGPDAAEYNPDRWDNPETEKIAEKSFLPFAAGKRNCIGKDFAMNEFRIIAALLIRNFRLVWPEGQPYPDGVPIPVVRPKQPYKVIVIPRDH